jgi:hypothetical protein
MRRYLCVYKQNQVHAAVLDGFQPGIRTRGKQSEQARRR